MGSVLGVRKKEPLLFTRKDDSAARHNITRWGEGDTTCPVWRDGSFFRTPGIKFHAPDEKCHTLSCLIGVPEHLAVRVC